MAALIYIVQTFIPVMADWLHQDHSTAPSQKTTTTPPPEGRNHGLNMLAYCIDHGFATSRPEGPALQKVKDWTCVRADGTAQRITPHGSLSFDNACQEQNGSAFVAINTAPDDVWNGVRCVER
ncbi:hypothetical protein PO587_38920 [Streptomyces gilvifuscus]|uniref:Uncharacterized protein n=1 Tax=Streptomyces gilvifuscus TaxID=1550617 RepID=A0ABT5G6F4_9ACTN|nr:hypothetical protein [Streptomyces gilvifuscus]MDC2960413.1 hypothetical protein [Streptomyces gilvifuscus]